MKYSTLRSRSGSALVEMALVLPILVTLMIGVVELSQVLSVKQAITNASREGARAGAVHLDDAQALLTAQDVSEDYLTATGLPIAQATVTPSFVVTGGSDGLQVVIDYDFDSWLPVWFPGTPDVLTLRSAAIMRRET